MLTSSLVGSKTQVKNILVSLINTVVPNGFLKRVLFTDQLAEKDLV